MVIRWVKAGWILHFQYCKWLFFLHYFFNIKSSILFYVIKIHLPDCLKTLKSMFKAINLVFFFELRTL